MNAITMPPMLPTAFVVASPTPSCPRRKPTASGTSASANAAASMSATAPAGTPSSVYPNAASPMPQVTAHTAMVTNRLAAAFHRPSRTLPTGPTCVRRSTSVRLNAPMSRLTHTMMEAMSV